MRVDKLIIEDKAAGHSVAQEIRRLYGHEDWAVQLINPGAYDKLARLYSVQHLFAEGMIYAPIKQWADLVISQMATFPRGKHDDLVDTASAALRRTSLPVTAQNALIAAAVRPVSPMPKKMP
jgi:predicted phage terminase large subunit-like protein